MGSERQNHVDDSRLEAYSTGRLDEAETAELEEHLLICDSCRGRLTESEAYTHAMQSAARQLRTGPPARRSWLLPRLAPVLATAVLVVGIGTILRVNHRTSVNPVEVTLQATRGGGMVAQVPLGKPLLLKPNLDGLPAFPEYHLRILDSKGQRVWEGNFQPSTGARAPQQPVGLYFVELYSLPGALLREYAMEIKASL